MSAYITIRMTLAQAEALANAADVMRDQHEADGNKGEARRYRLAGERVTAALQERIDAAIANLGADPDDDGAKS